MAGQVSARARVRDPGASAEQRALALKIVLRVGLAALTVLAVIVLTFVLEFVIPANPARVVAGPKASSQVVAEVARNLGLNRPEWQQLLSYIGGVLHGDLGYSYVSQTSVTSLLAGRLPATALLMAAGIVVELAVGGALGLWDGLRPKRSWVLASFNIGLLSVPTFMFGFLLLLLFGFRPGSRRSPAVPGRPSWCCPRSPSG